MKKYFANKSLTIETKLNYLKTNSNAYSKRSRSFMPERLAELIWSENILITADILFYQWPSTMTSWPPSHWTMNRNWFWPTWKINLSINIFYFILFRIWKSFIYDYYNRDFKIDLNNVNINKEKPRWHDYFLAGVKGIFEKFKLNNPTGNKTWPIWDSTVILLLKFKRHECLYLWTSA